MPRILINARLWQAGGMETHLLHLCRLLVGQGVEVTLVSRYASNAAPIVQLASQIPIRLIRTPFHQRESEKLYRLSTLWALTVWPFKLKHKCDLLYSLELTRFNHFLRRFLQPRSPTIFNFIGASWWSNRTEDKANPIFPATALDGVDGIMAEGKTQSVALRSAGIRCPIRILPHIGHISAPPRFSRRLSAGDTLRLAFLGRFDQSKGISRLLELWPKFNIQPARLTFYGHGPEEQSLRAAIKKLGLDREIRVGNRWDTAEELADILDQTDLVIHASEVEGLSVALLEAMAHGVPFVASDVGATAELALDNPDVAVVPLRAEAFIKGVQEVARKLRKGQIDGQRLQSYHKSRFGYEKLSKGWSEALLQPESWISRASWSD